MQHDTEEPDRGTRRRELVQRFGTACEELVQSHYQELLNFVVHNGVSPTDADEPVNDTFMAAFLEMERTGELLQNPRGFLFHVASCRKNDYLQARYRRDKRLDRVHQHARTERLEPPDATAVIDDRAQLADHKRALCALPARQREAFVLHHYYGFEGIPEIAHVMGISRQAVRTHLARAEERFADLAREEGSS